MERGKSNRYGSIIFVATLMGITFGAMKMARSEDGVRAGTGSSVGANVIQFKPRSATKGGVPGPGSADDVRPRQQIESEIKTFERRIDAVEAQYQREKAAQLERQSKAPAAAAEDRTVFRKAKSGTYTFGNKYVESQWRPSQGGPKSVMAGDVMYRTTGKADGNLVTQFVKAVDGDTVVLENGETIKNYSRLVDDQRSPYQKVTYGVGGYTTDELHKIAELNRAAVANGAAANISVPVGPGDVVWRRAGEGKKEFVAHFVKSVDDNVITLANGEKFGGSYRRMPYVSSLYNIGDPGFEARMIEIAKSNNRGRGGKMFADAAAVQAAKLAGGADAGGSFRLLRFLRWAAKGTGVLGVIAEILRTNPAQASGLAQKYMSPEGLLEFAKLSPAEQAKVLQQDSDDTFKRFLKDTQAAFEDSLPRFSEISCEKDKIQIKTRDRGLRATDQTLALDEGGVLRSFSIRDKKFGHTARATVNDGKCGAVDVSWIDGQSWPGYSVAENGGVTKKSYDWDEIATLAQKGENRYQRGLADDTVKFSMAITYYEDSIAQRCPGFRIDSNGRNTSGGAAREQTKVK